MQDNFILTIHMVSSLDGYIAKPDNSIEWFNTSSNYEKGVAGANPEEFLTSIDCYIMGSNTYELAEELSKSYGWPYGDKPTIVLSSRNLNTKRKNIEIYHGDLTDLVTKKLMPQYKNVWAVGGSILTKELLRLHLADEIRMIVLPIILGEGLPFFNHINKELPLNLKDVTAYKNGMVELRYERRK